jgi:hypothetical protein
MRKVGLRALKWPLKRAEVEGVIQNLERYKSSFLLSLQVDQTYVYRAQYYDSVSLIQRLNSSLMVGVAHDIDLRKLEGAIEAGFKSFSDRDEV